MITLILLILSSLGIIGFTWWIPLVEGVALAAFESSFSGDHEDSMLGNVISFIGQGIVAFSLYCLFCNLQVSAWWILASPLVFVAAFCFPGGITLLNLALSHFGLINPPIWILVIGVLLDLFSIYALWHIFHSGQESH